MMPTNTAGSCHRASLFQTRYTQEAEKGKRERKRERERAREKEEKKEKQREKERARGKLLYFSVSN